jgi:hypothetical protein
MQVFVLSELNLSEDTSDMIRCWNDIPVYVDGWKIVCKKTGI